MEEEPMRPGSSLALGLLALFVWAAAAPAQEAVLLPQTQAGQVLLVPERADGRPGPLPFAPVGGTGLFRPDGVPAAPAASAVGTFGPFRSGTGVDIGFDYIRPLWSFRDFTLAIPAFGARNFPLLGGTGHTDDHFAVAPRVDLRYLLPDSFLALGASGSFLNLSGNLQRQLESPNGIATLSATSSLTLVSLNLLEVSGRAELGDFLEGKKGSAGVFEDVLLVVGIAARYVSLDQNYTGSLSESTPAGVNVSTRSSTQSFKGFGIVGTLDLFRPVGDQWTLFSRTRASVLVGDNVRRSTLTVDVAGQPGNPAVINEDKTAYLPVGELEMGVLWMPELFNRRPPVDGARPPTVVVKLSGIAQVWGGVGPLSAGSSQGFRSSDLFLVGGSIMVGVQY